MGGSDDFFKRVAKNAGKGHVLHLGTCRKYANTLAQGKTYFPEGKEYQHFGIDIIEGEDVDFVIDVLEVSQLFSAGQFEFVIGLSFLEHVSEPWVAAEELATVTKLGGFIFIQTHQTFPLHNHPYDYWRFTLESLGVLFSPKRGWEIQCSNYEFPCSIKHDIMNNEEAYLNVCCCAERVSFKH